MPLKFAVNGLPFLSPEGFPLDIQEPDPIAPPDPIGEPFADGTFFTDGTGWTE